MRRRALRVPVTYLALVVVSGLAITGLLLRYDIQEDYDSATLVATQMSQSISNGVYEAVSTYYTPTVAGEGFVNATIDQAAEQGVSQEELLNSGFDAFAQPIVDDLGPGLLDYQLAPAGVVTYSARPIENAAALGHNLLADDERRLAIISTIESRSAVFSGPLALKQGGVGVIIRQAIFASGIAPFAERYEAATGEAPDPSWAGRIPDDFWGFATTVIDAPTMLAAIAPTGAGVDQYALQSVGADGALSAPIIGDWQDNPADAVSQTIDLPDGSVWLLSVAIPAEGTWHNWPTLVIGLVLTALATGIVAWSFRIAARNRIGFAFGQGVADLQTRQQVVDVTGRFLADLYPALRGSITCPGNADVFAVIGADPEGTDVRTLPHDGRTWEIAQGARVRARLVVDPATLRKAIDLNAIVEIISPLLAATLGSLEQRERIAHESTIDHLTEVFNRRRFQPSFEELQASAARHGRWIGVGVLDVDHFKSLNDNHGHALGDEALRRVGRALDEAVRGTDSVYRFGGDEFVVLVLVDSDDDADRVFTRVHARASQALTGLLPAEPAVTVSVGYCCRPAIDDVSMDDMLSRADDALYQAKQAGRDRVEAWLPPLVTTGPLDPRDMGR